MKAFVWIFGIITSALFFYMAVMRIPTSYAMFVWPLIWAWSQYRLLTET